MKLVSWNVNGLRAVLKKDFAKFVNTEKPDLLCLQEIKALPADVDLDALFPKYQSFWNPAEKKGYAGTLILSKIKPLSHRAGIGIPKHDSEGRVLTLELDDFFVVTVYTPNAQHELARIDYRKLWDKAFLKYVRSLEKSKPVAFGGDLNVAHKEIDLARPKENQKNPGFSPEERAGFDRIVKAGFIDSFREFEPGPHHYSWWSYRAGARPRNIGWRIDYWCISPALRPRLKSAKILSDIMGSDHCPVSITLS
ncbi:MAG: exodeoxyribonuclease III [Verrucomicrobiota bacterium]